MTALLRDRRGATSVLVVFMMVVLVVFATLAFTTSYANYKLSQKTSAIIYENYALETAAARMILKVDECLASAEQRAQTAVQGLLAGDMPGLTPSQVIALRETVSARSFDEESLSETMIRLYYYFAAQSFDELTEQYQGLVLTLSETYQYGNFLDYTRPLPTGDDLTVNLALTTGGNAGDKQLDVLLSVEPLRYQMRASTRGVVSGAREEDFVKRYGVRVWKQWQIPFTYDDSLEFGDARIFLEDGR